MPDIIAYDLIEEYSDRTVKKENQFSAGLYKEEQLKEKIYPKMLSTGVFLNMEYCPI